MMDHDLRTLPTARRDDVLVEKLPGEVVVYDLRSHQVHCLNPAAALAWELCDGAHTRGDLAMALQREFDLPLDEGVVDLTLDGLARAALLPAQSTASPGRAITRRGLVSHLALAAGVAALLPSVKSAQAQGAGYLGSCAPNTACVSGVNDCSPCYVPTPAPEGALLTQCENKRCWEGNCKNRNQTGC